MTEAPIPEPDCPNIPSAICSTMGTHIVAPFGIGEDCHHCQPKSEAKCPNITHTLQVNLTLEIISLTWRLNFWRNVNLCLNKNNKCICYGLPESIYRLH